MIGTALGSFLMEQKNENEWEKVVDIKDIPDLGGEPNLIEASTLSDLVDVYVEGREKMEAFKFKTNYTKTDYEKLYAYKGQEKTFAIWLGYTESVGTMTPTGDRGKFKFTGTLSVYVNGADAGSVVEMTVSIATTSKPILVD